MNRKRFSGEMCGPRLIRELFHSSTRYIGRDNQRVWERCVATSFAMGEHSFVFPEAP